ncbi:hypothetical protein GQX74_007331 [Glossina fuscipes]|nr:hypothetical protein GQX74_007331 [Glossina fuscipes]
MTCDQDNNKKQTVYKMHTYTITCDFQSVISIFLIVYIRERIVQICKYEEINPLKKDWLTTLKVSNGNKNHYVRVKHFLKQYINYTGGNIILATDAACTSTPADNNLPFAPPMSMMNEQKCIAIVQLAKERLAGNALLKNNPLNYKMGDKLIIITRRQEECEI